MNENYSANLLGKQILDELKGIRKDVKIEIEKIGFKLQEVLISVLNASNFDIDRTSFPNSEVNSPTENKNFEKDFLHYQEQLSVNQGKNSFDTVDGFLNSNLSTVSPVEKAEFGEDFSPSQKQLAMDHSSEMNIEHMGSINNVMSEESDIPNTSTKSFTLNHDSVKSNFSVLRDSLFKGGKIKTYSDFSTDDFQNNTSNEADEESNIVDVSTLNSTFDCGLITSKHDRRKSLHENVNHSIKRSTFKYGLDTSDSGRKDRLFKDIAEKMCSNSEKTSTCQISVKEELEFSHKTKLENVAKINQHNFKSRSIEQDNSKSTDLLSVSEKVSRNSIEGSQENSSNSMPESSQLPQLFDTMMASINAPSVSKSISNRLITNSVFRNQSLVKHNSPYDFYYDTLCTPISTADGEKKAFCCNICGRSFAKRQYAKTHYKMHIGEKTHECSVCKVGFLTRSNLKRHMIVHTGEKPHKCTICHRTFSFPSNMKRHMQNVHSKPPSFSM